MFYLDKAGEATEYGCGLPGGLGWHACPSVPVSVTGRSVRWVSGTVGGNWYFVKSYKVAWTYYVLR